MKIVMFNLKGGQGKSSIGLNLALTLKASVISNDIFTQVEDVMPEDDFMKIKKDEDFPDIQEDMDIIYDLGGWLDNRTQKIIKEADLIICPMINSVVNNKTSLNSLAQIKTINNKIIIVVNRVKKDDFTIVSELINKYFPEDKFPIFELKETTAFEKIFEYKKSINEIAENDKLLKFSYNKVINQFNNIINYINSKK